MKFAAWTALVVGLLMVSQWAMFLVTGQVPELQSEPWRIGFHLAAEFATAFLLIVGGGALLRGAPWAKTAFLLAAGMLLYSLLASPGYFAQQQQWPLVGMFAVLLVFTLTAVANVVRHT